MSPSASNAGKTTSLEDLPDGATIAVPNDATNEARALLLLEANGLITLREDAGLNATVLDIEENPHNYEITELEAAQVPIALPDVDIGVINGNFAIQSGLKASDALAIEDKDSLAATTYANVLCAKEGNEQNQAILDCLSRCTARPCAPSSRTPTRVPLSPPSNSCLPDFSPSRAALSCSKAGKSGPLKMPLPFVRGAASFTLPALSLGIPIRLSLLFGVC